MKLESELNEKWKEIIIPPIINLKDSNENSEYKENRKK